MPNDPCVRVNMLTEISDRRPKAVEDSSDRFFAVFGFKTQDLYSIALRFFKEKDGSRAVPISYKERLHLLALSKQVAYGKFKPQNAAEIGIFDVVGNDRKLAWQKLGDMPIDTAMCEFISILNSLCPLFQPYVTAHRVEKEEQERKRKEEEEELNCQRKLQMEEEEMKVEEERKRRMNQEMMIRLALNQQTNLQFRTYAEQHYPGKKDEQEVLIAQLQEQHFAQYMMQVYNQQSTPAMMMPSPQVARQMSSTPSSSSTPSFVSHVKQTPNKTRSSPCSPVMSNSSLQSISSSSSSGHSLDLHLTNGGASPQDGNKNLISTLSGHVASDLEHDKKTSIAAASLWTRCDIQQFRLSLREEADSFIDVHSGETITVRIPTHEDGNCLFWEFATEGYDIGFGVSFQWINAPSKQFTTEVTDSDMQDDRSESEWHNKSQTDVIVPVHRRDSHVEVHCGSHVYPGHGVYLFIFDNSYSLWRSKSVFYRVYYAR